MAGPWEKYDEPAVAGPWEKHAAPPKTAPVKLVNKDIKAGKEAPGWQQGLASVMQGPLLGFADEIGGLVGGTYDTLTQPSLKLSDLITGNRPKTFRENYEANRDTLRGMQKAQEEANPIFTMVTQGMGGMALAPFSGARAATGVIQGGMQAAKTGAATGAISGLGNSTATDIGGMAADTGLGATIGGVGGGVIQMGAAGGGGLVRNVAQRYSPGAADRAAHAKITEQLIRDSSIPDSALTQAEARLRRLGPEARIADTGGQNTKALLDTLATLPGRTKQVVETAIHDRQAGRAGRLMGAADAALGTKGQRMSATLEQLTEARSRNAAPFYAAIKGVDATLDNDMVTLLSRAKGVDKEALADFRLKTGIELPSLANMKAGETLPFEVLDTLKQTLYDSAQAAKRAGANGRGMLFDDLRVSLTNKLDDLSPKIGTQSAYKMARDEFAGKSQLIDAAEVGRKAMRGELFSVQESMKGMSKSETEAFRIGALEALREKTGKEAGQTELLKMWKEPATQDRLKLLFGNDYRQFAAAVASEARLKGLEGVGRGSQTASRLYGAGDLDISPLANVANVATSAKTGNLAGVLSGGVNLMRSIATPEPVRDRMGALLLSRNPQTLRDMGFLLPQINAARARAATASGLLGGQASDGVIGSGLFGN